MLKRPERFEDFIGHANKVSFFREHIKSGTLPNFVIIHGTSGVGKTTLARLIALSLNCTSTSLIKPCYKCSSCINITENVIRNNRDTTNVILRKMTSDKTSEILELFNVTFLPENTSKLIILDEAHRMSAEAQDLILVDTEFMPRNLYIIMLTSEIINLREAILSRAVTIQLNTLSKTDMMKILKIELSTRNLTLDNVDFALDLIITWAEYKPRRALKILEALGENRNVSIDIVKDFVSYIDTQYLIPLLNSFKPDSIIMGINIVDRLNYDSNTQRYFIDFLIEVIRLKRGVKTINLAIDDIISIREIIHELEIELILSFLAEIAHYDNLNRQRLLSAYLRVHPSLKKLVTRVGSNDELFTKAMNISDNLSSNIEFAHRPTLGQLQRGGSLLTGDAVEPPSLKDLL